MARCMCDSCRQELPRGPTRTNPDAAWLRAEWQRGNSYTGMASALGLLPRQIFEIADNRAVLSAAQATAPTPPGERTMTMQLDLLAPEPKRLSIADRLALKRRIEDKRFEIQSTTRWLLSWTTMGTYFDEGRAVELDLISVMGSGPPDGWPKRLRGLLNEDLAAQGHPLLEDDKPETMLPAARRLGRVTKHDLANLHARMSELRTLREQLHAKPKRPEGSA
jgi:hypothetical protein